ncbi:MAG TPA: hemolysin family protein [Candidatus Limnocylindrales bacterium]|nr:hemolysin family protein [Candidatus Limnocylindrales bacterium]
MIGMLLTIQTVIVLAMLVGLTVFAYLDRIHRELGRVTTKRIHGHLDIFEAEIEPRIGLPRRRAALGFSLLSRLWMVAVAVLTARGVLQFVPDRLSAATELLVFVPAEVLIAMHFLPDLLLARTSGRWLRPLMPAVKAFLIVVWPLRVSVELAASLARISDDDADAGETEEQTNQEGIEALVEAAQEEGIIEHDDAELIEQVMEFGDKRVSEVMTPRPDVIAISTDASLEELRELVVEKKFSRIPVFGENLDDMRGIVFARDLLEISDDEGRHLRVEKLVRPALMVPESKKGSELLKEMQRKNQQVALVFDEHGLFAGLVTAEDLVEEIVGEIGEQDRHPAPDAVRDADGSLILRGSLSLEKLRELFNLKLDQETNEPYTTVAGLLNHLAGHVPAAGERVEYGGLQFEVLEANQRKVLRLRARRHPATVPAR